MKASKDPDRVTLLSEAVHRMRDVLIYRAQDLLATRGHATCRDAFVALLVVLLKEAVPPSDPPPLLHMRPDDHTNELSRCLHAYRIISAQHWADQRFLSNSGTDRLKRKMSRARRGAGLMAAHLGAIGPLPEEWPLECPLHWQSWQGQYMCPSIAHAWDYPLAYWDYPPAYGYPYGRGFPRDVGFTPVESGATTSRTLPVPFGPTAHGMAGASKARSAAANQFQFQAHDSSSTGPRSWQFTRPLPATGSDPRQQPLSPGQLL